MLGPDVGVAVTDPHITSAPLWPDEAPAMTRAVPKRQLEFAAGRQAARAAIVDLGLPAAAIPQGQDRAPIWPDGLTGSIAHCDDICIAAVARPGQIKSLGVDIEPATPLESNLEDIICTKAERAWLDTLPAESRGLTTKIIFSAKEAVYKAQYPLTGQVIGFDEIELFFSPDQSLFEVNSLVFSTRVTGQTSRIGAFFLCTCALRAQSVPGSC